MITNYNKAMEYVIKNGLVDDPAYKYTGRRVKF